MPQWRVHFFMITEGRNYPSEQVVSANDRDTAVRIVSSMFGGQISLRWVEKL